MTPAQRAKAALRRLALAQQEPTPENFARAWSEEGGEPAVAVGAPASGEAWASMIARIVRGLERGSRQWTPARRKESLQRVLDGSRSDALRLQHRLDHLVASWDGEAGSDAGVETLPAPLDGFGPTAAAALDAPVAREAWPTTAPAELSPAPARGPDPQAWPAVTAELQRTLLEALPAGEPRAAELADELQALAQRIAVEGATAALATQVGATCERARRLLGHRRQLVDELQALCRELIGGITELAEDGSWAQGQAQALQARLSEGEASARSVRSASELLAGTRAQQRALREERDRARDALKALVQSLLAQLAELDAQTGRFSESLGRYAQSIEGAESIDSLAGLVRDMLSESRAVQSAVGQAQRRLAQEREQAGGLEARVRELEGELRRLSDEVSTDVLTQVANRRGLMQAFELERARQARDGSALAVGLIDIDNFKRLNDSLGHAAGDVALKALAAKVRDSLRPVDHVARYGGEEFVVLLPGTGVADAQQVLTRLQRSLSQSLFMHDAKEVFVTFSAGVTAYRDGEPIETALERADEALYEAKRTGKNRTCSA